MDESVIVEGWYRGRRFQFVYDATGDLQRDISQATIVDRALSEAGFLAKEPTPEQNELSETVNYVLCTITKNDKGTAYKIYLYTERFKNKFLHLYLNNEQDGKAFQSATGVNVHDLPVYKTRNALKRGEFPDEEEQYLVAVRPIRVFYKQNPRWKPDLSEADKKKIAKYLFVRWDSTPLSGQTDIQTTGQTTRQTDQTKGAAGVKGNASRLQSSQDKPQRRIPQENPTRNPLDNGTTRIETLSQVYRKKVGDKNWLTTTPLNSGTWTRKAFDAAGIKIDKEAVGIIHLGGLYNIISVLGDDKYYHIDRLEAVSDLEREIFHEGDSDAFGPPPDMAVDDPF